MDTKARIYIAGHRGLVGSALVRTLKNAGADCLITRSSAELDLTQQSQVRAFFEEERPEYVFLAAAKVGGILANDTLRGEFIYKNLMIQANVIHYACLSGVRRLIFLGSSCVYPRMAPQPIREDSLLSGPLETTNSPYAVAKIAGIEMCDAYNRQYGTSYLSVMPTNLYGPGDNFDLNGSHVLPALMRKFHLAKLAASNDWDAIAADEALFGPIPAEIREAVGIPPYRHDSPSVPIWGTGKALREFLHVDDMAAACVHLMFNTNETKLTNIGVGADISIHDVALLVKQVVGGNVPITWDTRKPDGTPRKVLDVERIKSLGWHPTIALEDGLRQTYEWYVAQLR